MKSKKSVKGGLDGEKLIELEGESKIFMQKLKNLYWPLSMGLNP